MTGWQTDSLIKRNFQSSDTLFLVGITKGMRRWKWCLSHFRFLWNCWLVLRKWPFPGRLDMGGLIFGRWEVRLTFNQGGWHIRPDLIYWIQKSAQHFMLCVTFISERICYQKNEEINDDEDDQWWLTRRSMQGGRLGRAWIARRPLHSLGSTRPCLFCAENYTE